MPNRKKWIRYVLYAVEILLLFLLQDTPGLLPQIMGFRCFPPRSPLPWWRRAHPLWRSACTPGFLPMSAAGLCSGITRSRSACCAFC